MPYTCTALLLTFSIAFRIKNNDDEGTSFPFSQCILGLYTTDLIILTQYHTIPHFDALKIYDKAVENIVRKGEIACNKQFLLFSQCFLPYMVYLFYFKCTLKFRLQFVSP